MKGKPLADVVGKEVADKIMGSSRQVLRGIDLKVGGEGMKGFYDQILPAAANKLVKKYGASVELNPDAVSTIRVNKAKKPPYNVDERGHDVYSIKLTPELRRAALQKGFPLFAIGGVAAAAAANQRQRDNDTVTLTPVDDDPFLPYAGYKPSSFTLHPVEHDPFN